MLFFKILTLEKIHKVVGVFNTWDPKIDEMPLILRAVLISSAQWDLIISQKAI